MAKSWSCEFQIITTLAHYAFLTLCAHQILWFGDRIHQQMTPRSEMAQSSFSQHFICFRLQCMPQSPEYFSLCPYILYRVWAGITVKCYTDLRNCDRDCNWQIDMFFFIRCGFTTCTTNSSVRSNHSRAYHNTTHIIKHSKSIDSTLRRPVLQLLWHVLRFYTICLWQQAVTRPTTNSWYTTNIKLTVEYEYAAGVERPVNARGQ